MGVGTMLEVGVSSAERSDLRPNRSYYPPVLGAALVVILLVLAELIAYFDRQILTLLVTPLKSALHLSDMKIGLLQGTALHLFAGLATLPLGVLVDRQNRMRLIGWIVIIWSVFTALSGLCTDLSQLFICRMGVGIAEAGLLPASYSLIADLYPLRSRATATYWYAGLVYLCASGGLMLSGISINMIARNLIFMPFGLEHLSVWRLAFLFAALPGIPLGLAFLVVSEPTRKVQENKTAVPESAVSFRLFMSSNWTTVVPLCAAWALTFFGVNALLTWLPAILERQYGLTPIRIGEWLGLGFGVGSLSGVALAVALTRFLRTRWGAFATLQVMRIGALGAAIALPGLLLAARAEQMLAVAVICIAMIYLLVTAGPVTIMSIIPNHLRGRVFAIQIVTQATAAAVCPPMIGALSDGLFHGAHSLLYALCSVVLPCNVAASLLLLAVTAPVRRMLIHPAIGDVKARPA